MTKKDNRRTKNVRKYEQCKTNTERSTDPSSCVQHKASRIAIVEKAEGK
jgi:hypothetical protein